MTEVRYERAIELMEAEIGDELVALSVQGGNCFGFNTVAASVWRELAEPRSYEQIKSSLLAEYDVSDDECDADLSALLNDMVQKGLIRADDRSAAGH